MTLFPEMSVRRRELLPSMRMEWIGKIHDLSETAGSKIMTHTISTSASGDFAIYQGDCRTVIPQLDGSFDMIFADPPYFLSNGGISVQAGKVVSVNKGEWDASKGFAADAAFNYEWIQSCREKLTEEGTIWICGTFHNIFSVANALAELDYRILNAVTWQKTNPPPNLSCRFFTHSRKSVCRGAGSGRALMTSQTCGIVHSNPLYTFPFGPSI